MSDFITRNKPDWTELELLVQRARRFLRRMSAEELSRIDVLYRRITIHLSQAATRTSDLGLVRYLNDLTAAAHSLIYLPHREPLWKGLPGFVLEGFARAVVRTWRFQAASALLLFGGACVAYVVSLRDPVASYALAMPGDIRLPGATREQLEAVLRSGRDQGGGEKFLFASFLFSHNLKVGLLALATGVLAGVPTMLLMLLNGMYLGAFVAVHVRAGLATEMWAWILPHGITELGAIVLCGGAGLLLGRAVISPGWNTRGESLHQAGQEAGRLCGGVGLMLLAAAAIESYLRQSHLSTEGRLLFAAVSGLFWAAYLLHGALRQRRAEGACNAPPDGL